MLQKLIRISKKTIAISEKELKLKLRFPLAFFTIILIKPFISLIPFVILYAGIFFSHTSSLNIFLNLSIAEPGTIIYNYNLLLFIQQNFVSSINQTNYLSWLLIGNIIFIFSRNGFDTFLDKFSLEKYWNTIQGTLLAPINRYLMLIGYIVITLVESFIFFIMMISICFIVYNVSILQIFLVFLIACLMIFASGGIGLIKGAIFLSNESYRPIFELFQFFILFLSCFSIPLEYFPDFLQQIIVVNPFYHGVELARNVYYGIYSPNILFSLSFIMIFAIFTSILGVYLFNKIWKKFGIHGY